MPKAENDKLVVATGRALCAGRGGTPAGQRLRARPPLDPRGLALAPKVQGRIIRGLRVSVERQFRGLEGSARDR